MSTSHAPADATAPPIERLADRPLRRLLRSLLFMAALCTAIALFLTVLDGRLGSKLAFSFAIGLSCWALIDGLRQGVDAARRGWARRRGTPAAAVPPLGWIGLLPLVAAGVMLGPPLGIALVDLLVGNTSPRPWDLGSRGTRITLAVTVLATLVAMVVISTLERSAAQRQRAEAAQRAAAEAQLRLLQSQLEPHMLFNTLANLRVLIGLDAARAQAMLDRLIAFLRATLAASRTSLHPLVAEFARVDDYLALMAVRMGPRLQTRLSLPPALRDCPVPPLLLQPLVENAIRHGLEPAVDGGCVVVEARRDGARLVLEVRDTGVGLGASPHGDGTGFGLQQVRDRLRTLYGDRAGVALGPAPDGAGTVATLVLPLPAAAADRARSGAPDAPGTGAAADPATTADRRDDPRAPR